MKYRGFRKIDSEFLPVSKNGETQKESFLKRLPKCKQNIRENFTEQLLMKKRKRKFIDFELAQVKHQIFLFKSSFQEQ